MILNKVRKVDYPIFKVVKDGAISVPVIGEGRPVPCVMIDIYDNVEVNEMIKLHDSTLPGDTEIFWSLPYKLFGKPKSVILNITFLNPMKMSFGIEFSISEYYSIIDGIVLSRVFALQTGKSGEKISTIFVDKLVQKEKGCILIEVPELDFDNIWSKLLTDFLKQKLKKSGYSRNEIPKLMEHHLEEGRKLWNIRRPIE